MRLLQSGLLLTSMNGARKLTNRQTHLISRYAGFSPLKNRSLAQFSGLEETINRWAALNYGRRSRLTTMLPVMKGLVNVRLNSLRKFGFVLILLFNIASAPAQIRAQIEELKLQLNAASSDTQRVEVLNLLCREYWDGDLDSSIYYGNEALKLSLNTSYPTGAGNAQSNIGVAQWYKGDYTGALRSHTEAWNAREANNDAVGVSTSLYNIGLIYDDQGNFPSALDYYLQSLRISDSLVDTFGISQCSNNVGLIYYSQGKYPEALTYLTRALNLRIATHDDYGLTESYSNLGVVHFEAGNYIDAKTNYDEALKLRFIIDDLEGIAISYVNYGDYYTKLGDFTQAERYYGLSLHLNDSLDYRKKSCNVLLQLSKLREMQKNYSEAIELQLKALSIAREVGANDLLVRSHQYLSETYSLTGDFENAFKHQVLFKQIADSLFNTSNVRQLTQLEMQYEYDKNWTVARIEQEKKDIRERNIRTSILAGLGVALLFGFIVFFQRNKIAKEKKRSDELLLNILPAETAEELKATGTAVAREFPHVTVLFTDFKNFTQLSEKLTAQELVNEINFCYSAFDKIITEFGIEKIKTIGDAYMCVGGLPKENSTHASDVVGAALAIRDFMEAEMEKREATGESFFEIRIGCNTGPVVAGIVGIKKYAYDIWGDTVNIASRMESSGETGKVNISGSTYELVKDKFHCEHRGKIEAKNKGMIDMYFAEPNA